VAAVPSGWVHALHAAAPGGRDGRHPGHWARVMTNRPS